MEAKSKPTTETPVTDKPLSTEDVTQEQLRTQIARERAEQARIEAQREADLAKIKAEGRAGVEAADADRAVATKQKREASGQTLDPVSNWASRLLKSWKTWLGIGVVASAATVGYKACAHKSDPNGLPNIQRVVQGVTGVADATAATVEATGEAAKENTSALTNTVHGVITGVAKTGEATGTATEALGSALQVYTPEQREEALQNSTDSRAGLSRLIWNIKKEKQN